MIVLDFSTPVSAAMNYGSVPDQAVRMHAAMFAPAQAVTDCRDPKDNEFLELARASGADVAERT